MLRIKVKMHAALTWQNYKNIAPATNINIHVSMK